MVGFYVTQGGEGNRGPDLTARAKQADQQMRIRDLEFEVQRLQLLNQALWELLRGKLNLTDAELDQKVSDVDLRDGVKDGRITDIALKCPTCSRISSSKHWKCLYCGQEFERPIMA